MKTIKVISDKIREAKIIGKPVEIFGEKFVCVDYPSPYMNSEELVYTRRVVHYKTGRYIPISGHHYKATAKDLLNNASNFLQKIGQDNVINEVNKFNAINL